MTGAAQRGERSAMWFAGGEAIREQAFALDWAATPLGPMDRWPQSLCTALSLCLETPLPACLIWGPTRAQLYNARYETLQGFSAAPRIAQDFAESWRDAWPTIHTDYERALSGEAAVVEVHPTLTLSLTPVRDESLACAGVFAVAIDTGDRAKLKRACEDVDSLNYIVAHDLHTPLRTMQEIGQLLLDSQGPDLPADVRELVQHLSQGMTKLSARTESLVRFTRVSQQPLDPRRVGVAALVSEIATELEEHAGNRRVSVALSHLPDVLGDPALIRQVFVNLISNAFKFTRHTAETRIEIGGARSGAQVMYHVRDNGVGFDMKYAGKLFGLFQRLHSEAQFEGVGAGLAVARRIVERHGGSMRAEGAAPGGATFFFTLPAAGV